MFVLTPIIFLQFITYGLDGSVLGRSGNMFLLFAILYPTLALSQWGMSIESNFFGGIWTKPLAISRLLKEKFLFSALLGGVAAMLAIPFCLRLHVPVYTPVSYALFSAGVGVLFALMDAYNCKPFDLFGKTFFNYQGSASAYKASVFIALAVTMVFPIVLMFLIPEWISCLILSLLGIAGIAFHRPYFRWVERKFLNNRYKYMEKYLSI